MQWSSLGDGHQLLLFFAIYKKRVGRQVESIKQVIKLAWPNRHKIANIDKPMIALPTASIAYSPSLMLVLQRGTDITALTIPPLSGGNQAIDIQEQGQLKATQQKTRVYSIEKPLLVANQNYISFPTEETTSCTDSLAANQVGGSLHWYSK